jgi:putative MATE family efflux protein
MFADYIKVAKSISRMSIPIGVGIVIQSLYLVIDLFFVSRLGADAIAGVTSTATAALLTGMLGQLLGIGVVSLIGQALGAGKYAQARIFFIHAGLMAIACSICVVVVGYMGGGRALSVLASGEAAQEMGESYLYGYMPGLALQIIITVGTFGLRAAGEPYGPLVAQCISVPINLVLAPVLIFGVPGVPGHGTLGAGLATTLATSVTAAIILYRAVDCYRHFAQPRITFRWESIIARRIITVGLPAGLETFVIYVYTGLMYWAAAKLGAQVQAAVGIGLMLIQALFIPSVSVAYGCVPIAAYYFGANDIGKVKKIYAVSLAMVVSTMLCLTAGCFLWGSSMVSFFSNDSQVEGKAAYFLLCMSLNFVTSGLIHINGSILQASGRTIWSLLAICTRLATFVIPLLFLVNLNKITLQWLCLLSNFAFLSQAIVSIYAVNLVIKRLMQITPEPVAAASLGFDTLLMNKEGRES